MLLKVVVAAAGLKHPDTKQPLTAADVMPWLRPAQKELTFEDAVLAFGRIAKGT